MKKLHYKLLLRFIIKVCEAVWPVSWQWALSCLHAHSFPVLPLRLLPVSTRRQWSPRHLTTLANKVRYNYKF